MPDEITAAPPPNLRRLFFGTEGLRAGWSLLLYGILVFLVVLLLSFAIKHSHIVPKAPKGNVDTPFYAVVIGESLQVLAYLIPAFILSRIEHRPFTLYGLATRRLLPDLLAGLLTGLLALSALVGTLLATHTIAFSGLALHGPSALAYAFKWLLAFFLVGLAEEFLFRGYLQFTLARGIVGLTRALSPGNRHAALIGFLAAAFLFSIVFFAVAHLGNPGENHFGIAAVSLAGAVFAFSLYRTGSLWWAIGFHTAWDWAQSYLYGTPDSGAHVVGHLLASHPLGRPWLSGGQAGPEGSLLVIPTLLLVALVIHLTLPKRYELGAPGSHGLTVGPGDTPPPVATIYTQRSA